MRKIQTKYLRSGMQTARPIYGNQGQILLNARVNIKLSYIKGLIQQGITHIYISDHLLEDVFVDDVVRDSTRLEAYSLVKDIIEKAKAGSNNRRFLLLKEKSILKTVDLIISDVLRKKDVVVNIETIKSADSYTFTHSVDVCILSTLTAAKMKVPFKKVRELAIGSLLHDLGKTKISNTILNKPGSLSEDEFREIQKHPVYGYEIIRKTSHFPTNAAMVISQHHERQNGQGYPHGLMGERINILAKIAAIADVYDALISSRPYRKPYHPSEAIEMLTAMGAEELDLDVLRTFLSFIVAYNVGTHVLLSNGESGIVIGNTECYPKRPNVRVLYEGDTFAPLASPYDLDMTQKLDITIVGVH